MTKGYSTSSNWANFWSAPASFLSGLGIGASLYRIYRSHLFHTRASLPIVDSVNQDKIDELLRRTDELSVITNELLHNSTTLKK